MSGHSTDQDRSSCSRFGAVNYVLKGGEQFNMVLLVPDDIPEGGATTVQGNVEEMRALYKDWDPR